LLDAFELIVRKYPDASLAVVGPEWIAPPEDITNLCLKDAVSGLAPFYKGSYLSQLQQKLSPEAAKRVTFPGLVDHSDVATCYRNADIYISPSLYESFGVTAIEAMAAGLPVIAMRIRAFEELISDGRTGLLAEAGSPSAIADAVSTLFMNDRLRKSIARAGREMVCKQFSWETVCSTLMQMYGDESDTKVASPDYAECAAR
jgi:glycosyltransferase involved in cell wall biosynthesis